MSPSRRPSRLSDVTRRSRTLLAVAVGGLLGSASRAVVGEWVGTGEFPTAVLVVNLAGSFLLGLYLTRRERAVSGAGSIQFWAIGALGSFTTFSAFSIDLVLLIEAGRPVAALWYSGGSITGGLLMAVFGLRLGARVS